MAVENLEADWKQGRVGNGGFSDLLRIKGDQADDRDRWVSRALIGRETVDCPCLGAKLRHVGDGHSAVLGQNDGLRTGNLEDVFISVVEQARKRGKIGAEG